MESTHQTRLFGKFKKLTGAWLPNNHKPLSCPIVTLPNELLIQILQEVIPSQVHILTHQSRLRHLTYAPSRDAFGGMPFGAIAHPGRRGLWRAGYPQLARKGDYAIPPKSKLAMRCVMLGPRGNGRGPLAAARTCRKLRDVMDTLLYEEIGFDFNDSRTMAVFLQRVPKQSWRRIRDLSLVVDTRIIIRWDLQKRPPTTFEHDMWEGWTWSGLVDSMAEMALKRLYVFAKGGTLHPAHEAAQETILQPLTRVSLKQPNSFWVVFVLVMDGRDMLGEEQLIDCPFRLVRFDSLYHPLEPELPLAYEGNVEGVRDELWKPIRQCSLGSGYLNYDAEVV